MSTAIYPGSFDPITNGHVSILQSGLRAFDRIVVAVLHTPKKSALFSVEERITTLQDKVRLAHQQMQGIQQEAEGAAAAAEVRRAEGALVQRNLEEEVARLRMRGKFLDDVPQEVADFVGAGEHAAQMGEASVREKPPNPLEKISFFK